MQYFNQRNFVLTLVMLMLVLLTSNVFSQNVGDVVMNAQGDSVVLKSMSIVEGSGDYRNYYLCSDWFVMDACSHYGGPESHVAISSEQLNGGRKPIKRIVFLHAQDDYEFGTRHYRIDWLDGTHEVVFRQFYYEHNEGWHLSGLGWSNFEPWSECLFYNNQYRDSWRDYLRFYWKG